MESVGCVASGFLHFYMARMAIFGSCSLRKRTLAERPQVPSRRSLK